jgi:hypothetical protein
MTAKVNLTEGQLIEAKTSARQKDSEIEFLRGRIVAAASESVSHK